MADIGVIGSLGMWNFFGVMLRHTQQHNGVVNAMGNQHRLPQFGKEIIIVEIAVKQPKPDVRRDEQVVAKEKIEVFWRGRFFYAQTYKTLHGCDALFD